MNIYEKLLNVQTALKAPKSQYNNFGKYNYRNCEDILEAVKPLCATNKSAVFISDELVNIGDRYYIKATVFFTDTEKEGSPIMVTAYAREEADSLDFLPAKSDTSCEYFTVLSLINARECRPVCGARRIPPAAPAASPAMNHMLLFIS
jgi:hypothetical protein